ncbi:MAG: bifunctional pyr operon transcriptional regulator/uracil phosphoribosyltransferase PyrR [Candidatus Coatesbacteria bacterium]|nr:bifunctional pyr operon transcriptional regulator/uracil phosphoribosyltransferase PyrR [Candidatus Coatesbacteria bacterium]
MQTLDLKNEKGEFVIADAKKIKHLLDDLLEQIIASVDESDDIAFIGIMSRGNHLAKRLAEGFKSKTGRDVDVGALDIGFYRDDFATLGMRQPHINDSHIDFPIDGKTILLVDDVLYTGRTIRAALLCFADLGRTKCIRLVELIDRGLRELPVQADFLGLSVATLPSQWVRVEVTERDGRDIALLYPSRRKKGETK